ncbi:C factor cell-cell signaling protein [Endozoicomonas montiporae]|uniref:C factor cell-cell signaling protein n=2 Tax=Endozoicomonas montiporae TaxID=1027273 RepID=A0A081N1Y9_9GAMM|nr:SDR family oxidoreductase [Endozoicomonas montiporae]AMO58587.1 C factor cell-cell signaling protein [Endozoicomonas montiporae CL-33]KEQ12462.1 C factor cell-cell signaling protein [Endozoicomonas montiporae]
MDILITGGNGGIGLAMVQAILNTMPDATVHATWRSKEPEFQHNNLVWHSLDLTDESQIENLSKRLSKLDWLINAAGLLHNQTHMPEKTIQSIESDFFLESLKANTLPSLLLARYFQPALKQSEDSRFAVISARVGSISDNYLGGWISYRCAKAALNMALKTISIEWKRTVPKCTVLALHPGTTNTPLSKPFQRNVSPEKLFSPEKSVQQLLNVIKTSSSDSTGQFLAYDGTELPW